MKIEILKKQDLNKEQLQYIDTRISDEIHKNDIGPCTCWNVYANGLYAAIDKEKNIVVALIEASGAKDAINPGWWVDSKYREKGYGKAIVKELACYFKKQGYTGVGEIRIQTYQQKYDAASTKLKELFVKELIHS